MSTDNLLPDDYFSGEEEYPEGFQEAIDAVINGGNRLLESNDEPDAWDVASGLLAGAVHFWLFSRQPCSDPLCESCSSVSTAEQRLARLMEEVKQHCEESEYFHTPLDRNAGTA